MSCENEDISNMTAEEVRRHLAFHREEQARKTSPGSMMYLWAGRVAVPLRIPPTISDNADQPQIDKLQARLDAIYSQKSPDYAEFLSYREEFNALSIQDQARAQLIPRGDPEGDLRFVSNYPDLRIAGRSGLGQHGLGWLFSGATAANYFWIGYSSDNQSVLNTGHLMMEPGWLLNPWLMMGMFLSGGVAAGHGLIRALDAEEAVKKKFSEDATKFRNDRFERLLKSKLI